MRKVEIRRQINNLRIKKRSIEIDVQKCNRAITKLDNVLNNINKCKNKLSDAKIYLDKNVVNGKPADKGKTNNNLKEIETIKNNINSLKKSINNDITNYQNEIYNINNEISQLEYELTIVEE